MYVYHFTSNLKVRCKRGQVICQSLTYAPSKSNCNRITPYVLHVIVAMQKVMNQFGFICNNIHSWQINDSLVCPWLTQLGGGTVIGRQSYDKIAWNKQVLFSCSGCNKIIKLRIIGINLYFLLKPTLYQSSTFCELVNNCSALALKSAVLWDDVTGETDGSKRFVVCKNT